MKRIIFLLIFGFVISVSSCNSHKNGEIANTMDNTNEAVRDIIGNILERCGVAGTVHFLDAIKSLFVILYYFFRK